MAVGRASPCRRRWFPDDRGFQSYSFARGAYSGSAAGSAGSRYFVRLPKTRP
jgi:hypothetical protein